MLKSVINFLQSSTKKRTIPSIKQITQQWNEFSTNYEKFDSGPQTFYYSLTSLMQLQNANKILEVGCGTGKLIPYIINQKNQQTQYFALDIAQKMVSMTQNKLRKYFMKFSSKFTYDQWKQQNNIKIICDNAQKFQLPQQSNKFDRIICNCIIMLTNNSKQMLINLHKNSEQNCLLGISVWGRKQKNNLMNSIRQSILQCGYQLPMERSNFHLHNKIPFLGQQCGWKTLLHWEQNCLFPILQYNQIIIDGLLSHQINKLPQEQRQIVKQKIQEKIYSLFLKKQGLSFCCDLTILRKM